MQRDEFGVQVVDAVALEDDGGACYPEVGVELACHAAREAHQAENYLIVLFIHAAAQVAFGDDDRVARSRGEDGEKGQEVLIFGHDMALTVACNDLTKHAVTHGSSLVVKCRQIRPESGAEFCDQSFCKQGPCEQAPCE